MKIEGLFNIGYYFIKRFTLGYNRQVNTFSNIVIFTFVNFKLNNTFHITNLTQIEDNGKFINSLSFLSDFFFNKPYFFKKLNGMLLNKTNKNLQLLNKLRNIFQIHPFY